MIEMFGKRVLILPAAQQKETKSGLIVPVNDNYRPEQGTVVAAGSEVRLMQVNDKILYGRYSGSQVSLDGQDYYILHEEDIYGKFLDKPITVGAL